MSVQLTRLCHDVVQCTYKDLHSLVDSLVDVDAVTRHTRFVDLIMGIRHRFARLLVTVRWFMSYSAFHNSAQATRAIGMVRSEVLTGNADALWAVSGIAKGAAAQPSAVQEAAEVLGAAPYLCCMPRCVQSAIGPQVDHDWHSWTGESTLEDGMGAFDEASVSLTLSATCNTSRRGRPDASTGAAFETVERLRMLTLDVISRALPDGVGIVEHGVDPAGAAVRIGVLGAWTADVILDQLKIEHGFIALLRYRIAVRGAYDAISEVSLNQRHAGKFLPLPRGISVPLRQMLQDRFRWAVMDSVGLDGVSRMRSMLGCLSRMLSYECCGRLAMTHVRAQVSALVSRGEWSALDFGVSGLGSDLYSASPVRVQFWKRSPTPETLTISVNDEERAIGPAADILKLTTKNRTLLGGKPLCLKLDRIDVHGLITDICRRSGVKQLLALQRECHHVTPSFAKVSVSRTEVAAVALVVSCRGIPSVVFGISLKSGGFFVRPCGVLRTMRTGGRPRSRSVSDVLWEGQRFLHFSAARAELRRILLDIAELMESCVIIPCVRSTHCGTEPRSDSRAEAEDLSWSQDAQVCSDDTGASQRHSPRKRPYREGISDRDVRPGVRHPANQYNNKRFRTAGIDGRGTASGVRCIPAVERGTYGMYAPFMSSKTMADTTLTHLASSEKMRLDYLLKELVAMNVAQIDRQRLTQGSSSCMHVVLKTAPFETESSIVNLRGPDGWETRIQLKRSIFDSCVGGVVSYCPRRRYLTFSYQNTTRASLNSFRRDLVRARTSAALAHGLSSRPGRHKVTRRLPTHVEVQYDEIILIAGLGKQAVELRVHPPGAAVVSQLVPLMEEILKESGREMGIRFADMLNVSLPIGLAIQAALPVDSKNFRIRFLTVLRARFVVGSKQKTCAIDLDGRSGNGDIVLIDVARAHAVSSSAKGRSGQQFSPLPNWDAVLSRLVAAGGKRLHDGAAMLVPCRVLSAVLRSTVQGLRGLNDATV